MNDEVKDSISDEEIVRAYTNNPALYEDLLNTFSEMLDIRGEWSAEFVTSIETARLKVELKKVVKGDKPDEKLRLEYERFVKTRNKELASRSHTEMIGLALEMVGDDGKMSFKKKFLSNIGRAFTHSIYPDPKFFDR